ncbi:MAG: HD domain-containing protein, partial [Clostridia bacterium]|nr:HD domain-containing protein [Clostridia bacterium]
IDPATDAAIRSATPLLAAVSVERIFVELRKLLCGDHAADLLRDYADVLFYLLPALAPMRGCAQHHERHVHDVWDHTRAVVAAVPPDPHLRLAALLHDSGKPACKTTDDAGVDHFYGHAVKSAEIADAILRQYKTSNRLRQQVCTLVELHDFVPDRLSRKTWRKKIHTLGEETVRDLFRLREADLRAQNPAFLAEGLAQNAAGLAVVEALLAETPAFGLRDLAVNGADLAALGIPPSPRMGKILDRLLDEVQADTLKNETAALLARAEELNSGKETL